MQRYISEEVLVELQSTVLDRVFAVNLITMIENAVLMQKYQSDSASAGFHTTRDSASVEVRAGFSVSVLGDVWMLLLIASASISLDLRPCAAI